MFALIRIKDCLFFDDMSANKRQSLTTRSVTKKRKSFENRICDDLCEELLKYLPFEDRFRLESVSKQFQRTIFSKQTDLTMDYSLKNKLKVPSAGRKVFALNLSAIETILKKCRNIRSINLNNLYYSCNRIGFRSEYNKLIAVIANSCNNLVDFECYVNKMNKKTIQLMAKKLGLKLSSFRFLHSDEKFDKNVLISLPNLKDLSLNSYLPLSLSNIFQENQCLAKNLKKFSLNYDNSDLSLFENFVKSNPNLEILNINSYTTDANALNLLLIQISNLKNLKKLDIITDFEITDNSIAKTLRLMAKKLSKLKKIHFNLFVDNDNHSFVIEIIDSLKHFPQLKRVHLSLDSDFNLDLPEDQILISCQMLSGCRHLSHLSIYSGEISDSFFANISTHLPNLRDLHVLNANITISTLDELSKLKNIQKLSFYQKYCMVRLDEQSVFQMYDKCPKLEVIKFMP